MFALFAKLSTDLHLPALTGYIPQSNGIIMLTLHFYSRLRDARRCFEGLAYLTIPEPCAPFRWF